MCAGLCGHGLGATPSAIVNMTAVCERYGMSSRAFMIVPIVGAFLVDIIYQPQTSDPSSSYSSKASETNAAG